MRETQEKLEVEMVARGMALVVLIVLGGCSFGGARSPESRTVEESVVDQTPEPDPEPVAVGKDHCQKCSADMNALGLEYVCGYRCTFCEECATRMKHVCPNCSGQLEGRDRPKR